MDKKRLLVIANSFPDKADTHAGGIFIKEQVRALAPHLEEVHVIYPSSFGLSHKPREDFRDYAFGNVHVHFLSYFNVPLFLRVFRRGFTFLMARGISRLVARKGIRFDIIHAHFTWPSGAAAARLKKKYGVPVVVTEHTSIAFEKALATKDPMFMDTWFAADAVIRIKEGDIERMSTAGVPGGKLHFIPNGFDGSKFKPMDRIESRKQLGLPVDRKVVVSIGSLHDFKGHKYLVEAIAEVVKTHKSLMCYIVGAGPLMTPLQGQIASLGLSDNVKLVGSRPYDEMPFWMNSSDLVVHPSLSESGPMVMFEALGCGRPFIGTRVGSVPDVIRSEEVGIVCAPGDSRALSEAVVRGLPRDWDSGKISSSVARYSSERTAEEILSVYRRLLETDRE